ncbi:MAG: PAS domain-containing protein, partial [Candidatus Omnitrophica bacterium]|nr:PAS domain-containing protein [Candidatus Omnitrophota bacterium]
MSEFLPQEEKIKEIILEPSLEILNCIPKEICFISPQMEVIWMNKTFKMRFPHLDLERNKPLCYKLFFSPPKENPCSFCPVIKSLQTGNVEVAETEPCKDGRISRIFATPIKDKEGKIICVMETVEDITKIKSFSSRLEKLQTVFLQLGTDFNKNIELLVSACGEL